MTATTIKVDSVVRDRLARVAADRGMTMGALLAEIVDRLEREGFFATAQYQLRKLRDEDPQTWAELRASSRAWQGGTGRDGVAGAEEDRWWE